MAAKVYTNRELRTALKIGLLRWFWSSLFLWAAWWVCKPFVVAVLEEEADRHLKHKSRAGGDLRLFHVGIAREYRNAIYLLTNRRFL